MDFFPWLAEDILDLQSGSAGSIVHDVNGEAGSLVGPPVLEVSGGGKSAGTAATIFLLRGSAAEAQSKKPASATSRAIPATSGWPNRLRQSFNNICDIPCAFRGNNVLFCQFCQRREIPGHAEGRWEKWRRANEHLGGQARSMLLIDESGHGKKGRQSLGRCRSHIGVHPPGGRELGSTFGGVVQEGQGPFPNHEEVHHGSKGLEIGSRRQNAR